MLLKMRKTMVLLTMLLVVFAPGCGLFGTKERIVFVREDLTVEGSPRQILKLSEPVEGVNLVYYNGDAWIVVPNQDIPAGWLIVSPKVIEEDKE
jgi:hypothetical protein